MSNYELLKQAIQNKQQVIATYHGYRREMCPHALGRKNGKLQCIFYQFAGESSSGPIIPESPNNWRCIPIDGLSDITVRDGEWFTAGRHSRPNTCIDVVEFEVAY
jgi:hypothetical protein